MHTKLVYSRTTTPLAGATSKKQLSLTQSPLWLGDDLEFWPDNRGSPVKFAKIAALHSELVAVSDKGHLYQWRWVRPHPLPRRQPIGKPPQVMKGVWNYWMIQGF